MLTVHPYGVAGQFPTLATQARNLAQSVAQVAQSAIQGGDVLATSEEVERRLGICRKCDKFVHESGRCVLCGCFMHLKARAKALTCPDQPPRW